MQLRPFQKEALQFLDQQHAHLLIEAPTGSGKSLIFERACQKRVRAILISPLIALARQQALSFRALGIPTRLGMGEASFQFSSLNPKPEHDVWILSPEKCFDAQLQFKKRALEALRVFNPNLLIVDECHCIWEWGEDFRPAFSAIPSLVAAFQIERSIWLTATCPPDLRLKLQATLPRPFRRIGAFAVPSNLSITKTNILTQDRFRTAVHLVNFFQRPGIIFSSTRSLAERLFTFFQKTHGSCERYHAGLSDEERRGIEERLLSQSPRVLISTSAFGMGMNYTQFEWCLLFSPPLTLLALAQAIGRVTRKKEQKAFAHFFWDESDFRLPPIAMSQERQREEFERVRLFLKSDQDPKAALCDYFSPHLRDHDNFLQSVEKPVITSKA